MPGAPLNPFNLPLQADTVAVAVGKISEALQTIQTDLEAKVVAAEIDINGNLDFNGWGMVGATFITLETVPDADDFGAGSHVYSGGEHWLVTGDGSIQVTLNGALNAAGFGAIVGSGYGVAGAFVTFNDVDNTYEFTSGIGVWADIDVKDVILHGTAGSVTLHAHSTVAAAPTLSFTDPTSLPGTSLMHIGADGLILYGADEIELNGTTFTGAAAFFNTIEFDGRINVFGGASIDTDFQVQFTSTVGDEINIDDGSAVFEGGDLTLNGGSLILGGAADIHHAVDHEMTVLPQPSMCRAMAGYAGGLGTTQGTIPTSLHLDVDAGGELQLIIPFQVVVGSRVLSTQFIAKSVNSNEDITQNLTIIHANGTTTDLGSTTHLNISNAAFSSYANNATDYTLLTGESVVCVLTLANNGSGVYVTSVSLVYDRP